MDRCWDDTDRGRRQCLEKNCHSPTLSTTNHTLIEPKPLQLEAGSHLRVYIWLLKLEEKGKEEESCVHQKGCWLFLQRATSYSFIVFLLLNWTGYCSTYQVLSKHSLSPFLYNFLAFWLLSLLFWRCRQCISMKSWCPNSRLHSVIMKKSKMCLTKLKLEVDVFCNCTFRIHCGLLVWRCNLDDRYYRFGGA